MKATLLILSSITLSTTTINFNHIKNENKITQLYVLEDSLSDSNNLANILDGLTWNIHKVNFKNPFYDNSFTNGDTAGKILGKKLNLTLNPVWETKTIGNNYAVAGARTTEGTDFESKEILNRATRATIEKQTNKLISEHTIKSTDEIFLEIGGNDLIASMEIKNVVDQEEFLLKAVNNEINAIQNLINHGSKNLIISNATDISYVSRFNTSNEKSLAHTVSTDFNNFWAKKLNN